MPAPGVAGALRIDAYQLGNVAHPFKSAPQVSGAMHTQVEQQVFRGRTQDGRSGEWELPQSAPEAIHIQVETYRRAGKPPLKVHRYDSAVSLEHAHRLELGYHRLLPRGEGFRWPVAK